MYRSNEERKEAVRKTGGKPGKTEWFKRLGYQNTLQVPATLGSRLATIVKNVLDKSDPPAGFKTLVLEDGGRSIKSDIVKSDPFPKASCDRETCLMCSNEPSGGKCWSSSVVYKIACNRRPCKGGEGRAGDGEREEGCVHQYVGETSGPPFTRGTQHMALYANKSESSFMWRHAEKVHGGVLGSEKG